MQQNLHLSPFLILIQWWSQLTFNILVHSRENSSFSLLGFHYGWLDELELYALINLIQSLLKICSEGTLLLDHALQEEFRHSIFYVNRQSRSSHYYNHRDIYNGLW